MYLQLLIDVQYFLMKDDERDLLSFDYCFLELNENKQPLIIVLTR